MATKILKVFCSPAEQKVLAADHRLVADYPAFVVLEVASAQAGRIARSFPVEDITEQYVVRLAGRKVSTAPVSPKAPGDKGAKVQAALNKKLSRGPHHYIVQFVGPIKDAWLREVQDAGGELRAPLTGFAYIVRASASAIRRIAALRTVRWWGHLPHRDRIDAEVLKRVGRDSQDTSGALPRTRVMPGVYKVEFFAPENLQAAVPAIKRLGFKVLNAALKAKVAVVQAPPSASARRKGILALAALHGVSAIRERALKRPANDVAAGIMSTTHAWSATGLKLSGRGEVIGICDTGLDTGDASSIHEDFSGRIVALQSYPITPDFDHEITNPRADDGPADLDSGHGTHVAGSVLGSGAASAGLAGTAGPIRGLSYNARLFFQAVEQELKWKDPRDLKKYGRYLLAGIPLDATQLFNDAYRRGVRIHSNSWGGGDPGKYDSQCEQFDRFVWEHKNFCVLVAAGNDGTDKDGNGTINPMSVTSPGTAKNCITVGACENLRPAFNADTYGAWWPEDYPAPPYKKAPMADNPEQVAAFSSRGPTKDGRIKPEVVAPGTFVLSTRSSAIAPNNKAWGAFPGSSHYFYMGGTSMATPLTAGAVGLLREYLRTRQAIRNPSAALLKAALIAGATRLRDARGLADNDQGFGRVNLDAVVAPDKPFTAQFFDIGRGLRTGESARRELRVKSAGKKLRVVLAFTDYPGPALVNNLNLILTAPNGKRYLGNQNGAAIPDTTNNVEVIEVNAAAKGDWQVEVIASNVPHGPQDYALVVMGAI